MRPIMALGVAVAWAVGGCGLDESGQAAVETGGAGGIGGGGGVKDASFGGKPDAGGAPDAALGGNGGSFGGSGGTLSTGGTGGSGGTAGSGTGGATIDCSGYPNAIQYVLPSGQTHCYWVNEAEKDFDEARNDCAGKNGYLATLHSAEEMATVRQLALPEVYPGEEIWIGGSDGKGIDDPTPGTFGWITNEPWTYQSWALGEPNTYCDKCQSKSCFCEHRLTFNVNDGGWNDRSDDNPFRFVCEAGELVK